MNGVGQTINYLLIEYVEAREKVVLQNQKKVEAAHSKLEDGILHSSAVGESEQKLGP